MKIESKLIPIMREGVEVVKMVCFKKLHAQLAARYPQADRKFCGMLTGAVVNEIFGTPNEQEPFASFGSENREIVKEEIKGLAVHLAEMKIPLTDALRMQVMCDKMENIAENQTLNLALDNNILIVEREMPLPHNFMDMVRRIGKAFGLIIPALPSDEVERPNP